MNYIVGENRNQIQMIALEQLFAPDSRARVIDLFVDILPIDELGFKHVKLQSEGRPPYNPVTLLKLYLYGYKHSIRSSRKLEHSCKVNVELWWLLGGLIPSFRTIAYYSKNNAEAFRKVFRQFVLMLKDMGLIEGETIGIDSFKIIERSEYQDVIDENNARVIGNRNYYKLRQQIIEHQFGILKRQWGFTYTLMKGKANVLSEVNIFMTIYNLTRCINIMGMDELKRRLRDFLPLVSLYMSLLLIKNEMQKKEFYLAI